MAAVGRRNSRVRDGDGRSDLVERIIDGGGDRVRHPITGGVAPRVEAPLKLSRPARMAAAGRLKGERIGRAMVTAAETRNMSRSRRLPTQFSER
jgi:hypothetical protein